MMQARLCKTSPKILLVGLRPFLAAEKLRSAPGSTAVAAVKLVGCSKASPSCGAEHFPSQGQHVNTTGVSMSYGGPVARAYEHKRDPCKSTLAS